MTSNLLAVVVQTDEGTTHQVALNTEETDLIRGLITELHGGKVKVLPTQLLLTLTKQEQLP